MTYKLAFNESALKEWKKLGHTLQVQFKETQRAPGEPQSSGITATWT
jgi:mRNA-degrading endonuclease RelE of RelBE toxin-antitoxin system